MSIDDQRYEKRKYVVTVVGVLVSALVLCFGDEIITRVYNSFQEYKSPTLSYISSNDARIDPQDLRPAENTIERCNGINSNNVPDCPELLFQVTNGTCLLPSECFALTENTKIAVQARYEFLCNVLKLQKVRNQTPMLPCSHRE